ncbi:hypothetical protein LXL04_014985 [Taraxacum kok-saghyz]
MERVFRVEGKTGISEISVDDHAKIFFFLVWISPLCLIPSHGYIPLWMVERRMERIRWPHLCP